MSYRIWGIRSTLLLSFLSKNWEGGNGRTETITKLPAKHGNLGGAAIATLKHAE